MPNAMPRPTITPTSSRNTRDGEWMLKAFLALSTKPDNALVMLEYNEPTIPVMPLINPWMMLRPASTSQLPAPDTALRTVPPIPLTTLPTRPTILLTVPTMPPQTLDTMLPTPFHNAVHTLRIVEHAADTTPLTMPTPAETTP